VNRLLFTRATEGCPDELASDHLVRVIAVQAAVQVLLIRVTDTLVVAATVYEILTAVFLGVALEVVDVSTGQDGAVRALDAIY
jgi:hypothetical protein